MKDLFKQGKTMKKYIYHVLVLALGYGIGFAYNAKGILNASEGRGKQSQISNIPNEFSEKALIALMKELKIKYPEVALSQARLETGNFTSDIFKENHNLFGMKMAELRPTSAIGINRGHASYSNWKESVVDYALYQSYIISRLKNVSKDAYREHIQKYYSETSDYLARIDRVGVDKIDDVFKVKL
ncbi:glucosaminidase domain-containing protein [Daejeonella lutea]|uniref:Mannosyl-glycoprotein endo-beta-N-acetylglucosaminidase n=1 Tax=Daejeonella lutea TaxID=572036 RepID=A0A1T5DXL3_9SPHI|nr:glucosaminidase domain-containing protein [Daejeonella lutea]SKB76253.1 Mannosyl-glycoprotein endo-beta-N-acetylglucosaminidase [Daejeonella lutea]